MLIGTICACFRASPEAGILRKVANRYGDATELLEAGCSCGFRTATCRLQNPTRPSRLKGGRLIRRPLPESARLCAFILLREWPPLFARGMAGLVAALILALVAVILGERLAVPRPLLGRLNLSAFFNIFAWMGFATLSLRWLSAGQGAMLVYTMPVWATLLAWPILGKRPALRGIGGLILCIAGISVLFGAQDVSLGAEQAPGALFALGAATLFALGTVALRPLPLPPFAQLAWQLAIGCAPMAAFGILFERPEWHALSAIGVGVMAYMTIVPMGAPGGHTRNGRTFRATLSDRAIRSVVLHTLQLATRRSRIACSPSTLEFPACHFLTNRE